MAEWLGYFVLVVVASALFVGAEVRRRREVRRAIDASARAITPPINGPGADA